MLRRLHHRISKCHFLPLCAVLMLAACQRAPSPPAAASGPEAAVQSLATHLRDDDLVGFAKAAVPPAEYIALETAWRQGRSRWPLTELPLHDQWVPMLATLSASGSELALQQAFARNLAKQDRDLRDAARSLGLFGVKYISGEGAYTDEERAHYTQVIQALSEWAQQAPLGDSKRAAEAIASMATAARATRLASEEQLSHAGMEASLRQLSPFFKASKATLARYGLPLDRSFSTLRLSLVEQDGARARVRMRYTLGASEIDAVVSLQRKAGRWYLADTLRHAQHALSGPEPASSDQVQREASVPDIAMPSKPVDTPR